MKRAAAPLGSAARPTILDCAYRVPKQRDDVKSYFAYLVICCSTKRTSLIARVDRAGRSLADR
jgi:hypothetical protein